MVTFRPTSSRVERSTYINGFALTSMLVVSAINVQGTTIDGGNPQTESSKAAGMNDKNAASTQGDEPGAHLPPPGRMYSASQIASMIERPTNSQQLLRNLKVALDADLLLQPAFYDPANVMKFFNATAVHQKPVPNTVMGLDLKANDVFVTNDDRLFPGLKVSLREGQGPIEGYRVPGGYIRAHTRRFASLDIQAESLPGFTVGVVRGIFGPETVSAMETGRATDGAVVTPTIKGRIIYENREKEKGLIVKIAVNKAEFQVKLDPPLEESCFIHCRPPTFTDGDVVKGLTIIESEP